MSIHGLIPGTGEYVALCCKKYFADVIKDFEMGRLPWIILVGSVLTHTYRILCSGEDIVRGCKVGKIQHAGLEDRRNRP